MVKVSSDPAGFPPRGLQRQGTPEEHAVEIERTSHGEMTGALSLCQLQLLTMITSRRGVIMRPVRCIMMPWSINPWESSCGQHWSADCGPAQAIDGVGEATTTRTAYGVIVGITYPLLHSAAQQLCLLAKNNQQKILPESGKLETRRA